MLYFLYLAHVKIESMTLWLKKQPGYCWELFTDPVTDHMQHSWVNGRLTKPNVGKATGGQLAAMRPQLVNKTTFWSYQEAHFSTSGWR